MERLTEKENDRLIFVKQDSGENIPFYWDEGWFKMAKKLADYEDLEEQGLLLKLPCKVGDSVFIIVGKDISKQKVKEIRIFDNRIEFVTSRRAFGIRDFGGNVFLTRKEAEEKLDRK